MCKKIQINMRKEFGKTIYAQFAGLASAEIAADAGDTSSRLQKHNCSW